MEGEEGGVGGVVGGELECERRGYEGCCGRCGCGDGRGIEGGRGLRGGRHGERIWREEREMEGVGS